MPKDQIRDTNDDIRNTRYLEFMVQDTGIGIAEQNLPVIVEGTLGRGLTLTVTIPINEP